MIIGIGIARPIEDNEDNQETNKAAEACENKPPKEMEDFFDKLFEAMPYEAKEAIVKAFTEIASPEEKLILTAPDKVNDIHHLLVDMLELIMNAEGRNTKSALANIAHNAMNGAIHYLKGGINDMKRLGKEDKPHA